MAVEVIINAAMSLDGRIALRGGKRLRLSGPKDKARVHKLRAECGAIAVGINTVLKDDPKLYVNHRYAYTIDEPYRVVFDSKLRTPAKARVVSPLPDKRWPETIIFSLKGGGNTDKGWNGDKVHVETLDKTKDGVDISQALQVLEDGYGVQRLMVEGGGTLIGTMIREGLFNHFYLYVAPVIIGKGAPSVLDKGLKEPILLGIEEVTEIDEGRLYHLVPGE